MEHQITFLLFTYNEARRIEYVLRCFQPFGKVVVMDNHSTDDTAAIARRYGAEVYDHDHPGYVEEESVAANALSKVNTEWVYWGYCDEVLPKTLLRKLIEVAAEGRYSLVRISRKNLHYGVEKLNFDSGGRDSRFFRKGYMDFTGTKIHQFGRCTGKPEEILELPVEDQFSIYHCSTYNIKKFELAHSKYSDIEAGNRTFSPSKLFMHPLRKFFYYYFQRGAWKSGWPGFIMVMQYCFFLFNVHAKRWENKQGVTLESIEQNYDRVKERLLREE